MTAYYNEIDPFAAAWLRELIKAGLIAPGDVDERSIEDVRPTELAGYTQCHFFAGIGVWSYALRKAGWPDDRPVWTGSCPCQPFSSAGKGAGFADERHLWPAWFHLIQQCRPAKLFGEQVASKAADPWIDLVQADLEAMGYAFGCVPFPSAGLGAPHIRDRNFWVAHAYRPRAARFGQHRRQSETEEGVRRGPANCSIAGGMADARGERREGQPLRQEARRSARGTASDSEPRGLAIADSDGREARGGATTTVGHRDPTDTDDGAPEYKPTGPVNGFWADADWLLCRDGKWRPVEPGTFPLVDGAPARVGRLRGYGNAINAVAAQIFIEAVMEAA